MPPTSIDSMIRDHLASGGAKSVRELADELGVSVGSISGMLDSGAVRVAQASGVRQCDKCNAPSETALCSPCRTRLTSGGGARSAATGANAGIHTRQLVTSLSGNSENVVDGGSLHITGGIGPGWCVRAGFDLTVGGQVERAELEAGAGFLRLEAPCRQSEIRAGHLRELYGELIAALGDADRDLGALADAAEALQRAGAQRGQRLPAAVAVAALARDRWDTLTERLAGGEALVRSRRLRQAAVPETLLAALEGASGAILDPGDLGVLRSHARSLSAALVVVRAGQGAPPRSIVESLTECHADFAGALAVRGAGVHGGDLRVGGDLVLGGRGSSLGGSIRAFGKVVTPAIRGGTRLDLAGPQGGERLRAAVVAAGATITVAGQAFPFARETRGVVIRLTPGGPVLETG